MQPVFWRLVVRFVLVLGTGSLHRHGLQLRHTWIQSQHQNQHTHVETIQFQTNQSIPKERNPPPPPPPPAPRETTSLSLSLDPLPLPNPLYTLHPLGHHLSCTYPCGFLFPRCHLVQLPASIRHSRLHACVCVRLLARSSATVLQLRHPRIQPAPNHHTVVKTIQFYTNKIISIPKKRSRHTDTSLSAAPLPTPGVSYTRSDTTPAALFPASTRPNRHSRFRTRFPSFGILGFNLRTTTRATTTHCVTNMLTNTSS